MAAANSPADTGPRVRKDLARNRALLLGTADKLIAERGLEITFHELAAAAGVGVGTVYRHFADKDELIGALVENRFEAAREILLAAERLPDPIDALREAIVRTCELHQNDRGILQAMLSNAEAHRDLARERLIPVSARIVARAHATGRLRADFTHTDLPMIFVLSGALTRTGSGVRPDLWRRYVHTLIDGFLTSDDDRSGAGVSAPTEDQVESVMIDHLA